MQIVSMHCFLCIEPVAVGGGQSGDEERHTKGVGDPREGDQDPTRTDGAAPHQPRRHARLHGQPRICLRCYGGECYNLLHACQCNTQLIDVFYCITTSC